MYLVQAQPNLFAIGADLWFVIQIHRHAFYCLSLYRDIDFSIRYLLFPCLSCILQGYKFVFVQSQRFIKTRIALTPIFFATAETAAPTLTVGTTVESAANVKCNGNVFAYNLLTPVTIAFAAAPANAVAAKAAVK